MAYFQISGDDPTDQLLSQFWNTLVNERITRVKVEFDRGTAAVIATSTRWTDAGNSPTGARLTFYNVMKRWSTMAESSMADEEYEVAISQEIWEIFHSLKSTRPASIDATYISDGQIIERGGLPYDA